MPLLAGKSKDVMGENYRMLKEEGYPEKQRVAIMLSKAGKSNKKRNKKKKYKVED